MTRIALVAAVGILLASIVSGCRTVNVSDDHSIDPAKNTGVVVVSLTMSGLPASASMFVHYRGVGNDTSSAIPVNNLFASTDFTCSLYGTEAAPCGRLAVIELQPGEYEFYSWYAETRVSVYSPAKPFSKRFTVVQGKAVYLGNVHLRVAPDRFLVRVWDRRTRDLPLLQAKHPKLTDDLLIVNILPD